MRAFTPLGVNRSGCASLSGHDIQFADQTEGLGRQRDSSGPEGYVFIVGELAGRCIRPRMNAGSIGSVGCLGPLSFDPHEIGKARAIDVLVDHPHGDKRRLFRSGRRV